MKCPQCDGENAHHSRIQGEGEKLITTLTPLRYWRCHDCNLRFRAWRHARPLRTSPRYRAAPPRRTLPLYLGIALVVLLALAAGYLLLAA